MKPQTPRPKTKGSKLRFGLSGTSTERKGRIKAAIRANCETVRRLAK
jgi:hypothetical protein